MTLSPEAENRVLVIGAQIDTALANDELLAAAIIPFLGPFLRDSEFKLIAHMAGLPSLITIPARLNLASSSTG